MHLLYSKIIKKLFDILQRLSLDIDDNIVSQALLCMYDMYIYI